MQRLVGILIIASACAGGAPPATSPTSAGAAVQASDQAWEPCSVPVPENTGQWKQVEIPNATFCVPVTWEVSLTQARATGNRLTWGAQAQRQQVTVTRVQGGMSATSIANSGASSSGTTMARRITENAMIGGQMANVWFEEGTGRVATGIAFTDVRPYFAMTGEASGKANVELQLAIYRTIRFAQ
jgi:hypothetical protein